MVDVEREKFWLLDWEMARFDSKFTDIQEMCSFLWLFGRSSDQFHLKRVNFFLRRLQSEFFGAADADFRANTGEKIRSFFPIMTMIILSWKDKFGWHFENPRQIVVDGLNELKECLEGGAKSN